MWLPHELQRLDEAYHLSAIIILSWFEAATFLREEKMEGSAFEMADILETTIKEIEQIKKAHGVSEPTYINCVLTDGHRMVAVRYASDFADNASTLYYSEGSQYVCDGDTCHMRTADDPVDHAIIVVSEKLTLNDHDWKEIPGNHLLIVDYKLKTYVREMIF